jgi:hypothetical protein
MDNRQIAETLLFSSSLFPISIQTRVGGLSKVTIEFARELETFWEKRLQEDCADRPDQTRKSIALWLLGENRERFADMDDGQKAITRQAIEYRYRILHQRYLGANPSRAYRNLISRLGALAVLRNKIRTWVSLSRDRQRAVADVLQEVIQEMIESDRYIQATIARIARCSVNPALRNSLLLASIEEYCMRPIRNQPLLAYRFTNYLRRVQKGGMTQVPQKERIKMISEELTPEAGGFSSKFVGLGSDRHLPTRAGWGRRTGFARGGATGIRALFGGKSRSPRR